jgi:signal transduction histidine kinase
VQTKAASAILRGSKSLRRMIDDLLDVTRTRLGETLPVAPRPTNLADVCEQVVAEKEAHHPDHAVTLEATGDLVGTWDATRLAQMISNLVENGIRHGARDSPVAVTARGEEKQVVLTVRSQGDPIPHAAQQSLFEPMSRAAYASGGDRKAGGLGLGLYIARAIAVAHGGSIELASSGKEGTTFTVCLPRR